jgi:Zn-dependent peptidase ImmA (M78 family)/transcriptional regulator with XRE-family HTH domain
MIQGDRIKQVREMHRLTQSDLARDIPDLTQPQLSRIESGRAPDPSTETLSLLSAILGVTQEFFYRPPVPSLQAQSPQFRARSRLTESAKAAGLQWARLVHEAYQQFGLQGKRIPVRLTPMHDSSPQEAAHAVRELLGFSQEQALPYLVLAIERIGVTVLGLPYSADSVDAFSAWRAEEPVIALLGDAPGDRMRFSAAHELGHLVLHRPDRTGRAVEEEADAFAAELLTPRHAIAAAMPRNPTLSSLAMLKTEWGVSIKSLVRRARELGTIDADRATSLYRQMSARGWNKAEAGYVPVEKPRAFRKLAEIAYGPGPNTERLAADIDWSYDLAISVLNQHATADELPAHHGGGPVDRSNVVDLHRHQVRRSQGASSTLLTQPELWSGR